MTKPSKALQAKWNKKLADSGFVDIEEPNSPLEWLKRWDSNYFARRTAWRGPERMAAQADYYHQCFQFLHNHQFDVELERKIWAMHADGISAAQIKRKLRCKTNTVSKALKKLHLEMHEFFKVERSY